MNVDVLNRSGLQPQAASRLAIADCDVHPRPSGAAIGGISTALYPFLPQRWREHVESFGAIYRQPWEKGSAYPKAQPQACRRDAWPDGDMPGSDLAFMAAQHLDPNNVTLGILNPLTSGQGRRTSTCPPPSRTPPTNGRWRNGPPATSGCAPRWWFRMRTRRPRCGRSNSGPAMPISPRCCC